MKSVLSVATLVALLSTGALARIEVLPEVYDPMVVIDSRYGFDSVSSTVRIELNGERSVMTLDYVQRGEDQHVALDVYKAEADGCGSMNYWARLSQPTDLPPGQMRARYSVHLVDHTTRRCRDAKRFVWEADVRSGYGWCGTGDAEMTLRGNDRFAHR